MKAWIELQRNNALVKEWCVMWGEQFRSGDILPLLCDQDGGEGYLCDDCAYDPQNYASRLRKRAEVLESEAAKLRHLADIGVQPPDMTPRLMLEAELLLENPEGELP